MRMGELMVVVRAQDFASRTLRRVGAEMGQLSRAQRIAAAQTNIAFQKSAALARVAEAESMMRRVRYIETGRAMKQQLSVAKQLQESESKIRGPGGRFKAGIKQTDIRNWQNATAAANAYGITNKNLASTVRDLDPLVTKFDQRIANMPVGLQRAAQSTGAFGNALYKARRNLDLAYAGLSRAQQAELAFNQAMRAMPIQRLHEVGHALSGIGRTLQLFGAIGTAAFGLAAVQAANFSKNVSLAATQMTRIGAGTNEAVANAAELSDELLKLSKDFPFAASEMADAVYEIFSGTNVQRIDQGVSLLEAFARVAVAGQVDIQTATKAGIIVLNNFRGAGEDVSGTLNRMFAIVRFGFMRFSDFATMLPKVAAAAYGSGQSLDDMAGIMAFLTRRTGDASIAATQISRVFDLFARKEFETGLHKINSEFKGMRDVEGKLLPLPELLGNIMKAFPELAKGGKSLERFIQTVTRATDPKTKGLLSTAEARRFFRFVFRNFKEYAMLQRKAVADNGEFQRSFETMMKTPGVQWDIFVNRIKVGIVVIGNAAIPVFANMGRAIARFLDWWEQLDKGTRNTIVKWGVLISVGALVTGVLASIIGALISLALMFGGAAFNIGKFIAGLFGINKALFAMRGGLPALLLLTRLVGFLSAIGVITLALKVAWTGQATAIDFIMGAIAGAGAGFLLGGPPGAIVGAITVPVLLKWIADERGKSAADVAFDKLQESQGGNPSFFEALMGSPSDFLKWSQDAGKTMVVGRQEFERQWNELVKFTKSKSPIAGLDRDVMKFHPKIVKLFNAYQAGIDKSDKSAKNNVETWDQAMKRIDKLIKMGKGGIVGKLVQDLLADADESFDALEDTTVQRAQQLQDVIKQTTQQAMDSLRSLYSQLLSENEQAFGALFQGPWLTSQTFDLAKEWGITPRIQDIIRDLDEQIEQFRQRRKMIDTLFKRGLPQGFLDELRTMDAEQAMPLLKELVSATPKQTRNLVAKLNRAEKDIKAATQLDFTREIESFRKAGTNMGEAIINGFQSAGVGAWFDGWIKATFPDLINAAVAQAVKDWKTQNPKTVAPPLAPPPPPIQPPIQPRGNTTTTTTHTDNSKTANIHVGGGYEPYSPRNPTDELRRAAFIARNIPWWSR